MAKASDYQRRINAATNQVARNLDKNHSIEELAAVANFSKFHFHRIYRALSGETVSQMVSRLRLEGAAASLIYNKSLPITRVAVDHGYSSGGNFTKAFTKHFGCSPSAYRTNSKIGKAIAANTREDGVVEPEVTLGHEPETLLAYYRRKGPYRHLEIEDMHQKVQVWVEDRDCAAEPSTSYGVTWSDSLITSEENWIYDACVAVKPGTEGRGEISIQSLEGGLVAQLDVELAPNDNHDLSPYWNWLVRDWFMASKYELRSNPSYERYLDTLHGLKVRLCLPIELNDKRI